MRGNRNGQHNDRKMIGRKTDRIGSEKEYNDRKEGVDARQGEGERNRIEKREKRCGKRNREVSLCKKDRVWEKAIERRREKIR